MIEIAVAVLFEETTRPGGAGAERRVLVARRRSGAPRGGLWEFPGGKIEPGETPQAGAVREAREETGCDIEVLAPLGVSEEVDPRELAEPAVRLHAFAARARGGAPPRAIASEEIRWVSLDELDKLPMPGGNRPIVASLKQWLRQSAFATAPRIGDAATSAPRPAAPPSMAALLPILLAAALGLDRAVASPPAMDAAPIELGVGTTPLAMAFGRLAAIADESATIAPRPSEPAFGDAGTWRLNLLGGAVSDFSTTTGGEFRAEFEYFLIERFSLVPTFELGGFVQDGGDDPLLVSGALLLRWHFLEGNGWTVFADAGAGIAYLTGDLPPGTNGLKFNPQIGVGFTLELAERSATRLIGGVRWYHLSNARTGDTNDGFDGAEAYLGLSLPF